MHHDKADGEEEENGKNVNVLLQTSAPFRVFMQLVRLQATSMLRTGLCAFARNIRVVVMEKTQGVLLL